jgi:hypothetical protein
MIISEQAYARSVGALDKLLSQALESIIKQKLGDKVLKKIEQRLQERYNVTITDAIRDFHIFDATLREFFGTGADTMEEEFKERLISFNASSKGRQWITIENQELADLILESYGDKEKRLILNTALKSPNVILDILEQCNIPKSSGYRLVSELVNDGLLTEEGTAKTSDGKTVSKYTALLEKIKIEIEAEGIQIHVLLKEHILEESSIYKILIRLRGQS